MQLLHPLHSIWRPGGVGLIPRGVNLLQQRRQRAAGSCRAGAQLSLDIRSTVVQVLLPLIGFLQIAVLSMFVATHKCSRRLWQACMARNSGPPHSCKCNALQPGWLVVGWSFPAECFNRCVRITIGQCCPALPPSSMLSNHNIVSRSALQQASRHILPHRPLLPWHRRAAGRVGTGLEGPGRLPQPARPAVRQPRRRLPRRGLDPAIGQRHGINCMDCKHRPTVAWQTAAWERAPQNPVCTHMR